MKPTVTIDNLVYRKIMHWVNKSAHEVSGLGMVSVEPNGVFRVTHAMLLPQENTGTSTDIEPQDAAKMLFKCKDLPGDLRFWWHSHVEMPVFWSGTDHDTIKKLGEAGWFLSTVFNKKREMRSAYYSIRGTVTPWGDFPLFQDELATQVEPFIEVEAERWDAEYAENVKAKEYFPMHHWRGGAGASHLGSVSDTSRLLNAANKRPHGMSKKEWKRLRKEREASTSLALTTQQVTDIYGFTQEERQLLAAHGWSDFDVDTLFEEDVTPREIILLARSGAAPNEVLEMLTCHWTPLEIVQQMGGNDDVPVMDRANGGKYDA